MPKVKSSLYSNEKLKPLKELESKGNKDKHTGKPQARNTWPVQTLSSNLITDFEIRETQHPWEPNFISLMMPCEGGHYALPRASASLQQLGL